MSTTNYLLSQFNWARQYRDLAQVRALERELIKTKGSGIEDQEFDEDSHIDQECGDWEED